MAMSPFKLGNVKRGGLMALASAVLFGVSTPAAKSLIAGVHPLMLAGLLYLGSGIGLSLLRLVGLKGQTINLSRRDLPWLLASVVFGGILASALLMYGL